MDDYHTFNQLADNSYNFFMTDYTTHYITLVSKDKAQLLKMYNLSVSFKVSNFGLSTVLEKSKRKATNLITFIKKEFHLK